MKTLVDATALSAALRRQTVGRALGLPDLNAVNSFRTLSSAGEVLLIGAVRQEVLSGIVSLDVYRHLLGLLRTFPDTRTEMIDQELAAQYYNTCRSRGVQGSAVDFLLCAVATRLNAPILTLDRDFERYQRHVPVEIVALSP